VPAVGLAQVGVGMCAGVSLIFTGLGIGNGVPWKRKAHRGYPAMQVLMIGEDLFCLPFSFVQHLYRFGGFGATLDLVGWDI